MNPNNRKFKSGDSLERKRQFDLHYSSKTFVKIKDEKHYLNDYLLMEGTRYINCFGIKIDMSESIGDIMIPNFFVIPFIEICIKDFLNSCNYQKGEIQVAFKKSDENSVEINISDKRRRDSKSSAIQVSEKLKFLKNHFIIERIESYWERYNIIIELQINHLPVNNIHGINVTINIKYPYEVKLYG